MPINLDHVGLNTLINEPVSSSTNTVGYPLAMTASAYIQTVTIGDNHTVSIPQDDYLAALNIHRNGPYGWPAFNSTKISHNPITRYQNKNSIFSYTIDGDMRTVTQNEKLRDRFRERRGALKQITESPIYSNHKPLKLLAIAEGEEVEILVSPGNETQYFGDQQANRDHNTFDKSPNEFGEMLKLYKTKRPERSPIDSVVKLDYSQTIFPKSENSHLNHIRSREFYINKFWNDNIEDRYKGIPNYDNPFNLSGAFTVSKWPLDHTSNLKGISPRLVMELTSGNKPFLQMTGNMDSPDTLHLTFGDTTSDSCGILKTNLLIPNLSLYQLSGIPGSLNLEREFYFVPTYYNTDNRFLWLSSSYKKHSITPPQINNFFYGNYLLDIFDRTVNEASEITGLSSSVPSTVKWEADKFSGKSPFYDSYNNYSEFISKFGKNHSIIPEFIISDHISDILKNGINKSTLTTKIFNLSGGIKQGSDESDFYKIYSTTDFLKNFDLIQEENSSFINANKITLRCSAVKKLLPYDGFYPVQRTVELANIFKHKYKDNYTFIPNDSFGQTLTDTFSSASQSLVGRHLFSPGILYNTIKSGIAVDFPIQNDLLTRSNYIFQFTSTGENNIVIGDQAASLRILTGSFSHTEFGFSKRTTFETFDAKFMALSYDLITTQRAPFESIINPGKNLQSFNFPLDFTNIGKAQFDSNEDSEYNLAINNFLAETTNFFMKSPINTTIASIPQGDPNFGNAVAGRKYKMRLKMYRTTEGEKPVLKNNSTEYSYPQDSGSLKETFTMYTNPTHFGPAQFNHLNPLGGFGSEITLNQWSSFQKDELKELYYPVKDWEFQKQNTDSKIIYSASYHSFGNNPFAGENYPYTPPYFHGEAWADFTFLPSETKKYTLNEILNETSVEFLRYYDHTTEFDRSLIKPMQTTSSATDIIFPNSANASLADFTVELSNNIAGITSANPNEITGSTTFTLQMSTQEAGSMTHVGTGNTVIAVKESGGAFSTAAQVAQRIAKAVNGTTDSGILYQDSNAPEGTGIPHISASYRQTDGLGGYDSIGFSHDGHNSGSVINESRFKKQGFFKITGGPTAWMQYGFAGDSHVGLGYIGEMYKNHHLVNESAMQLASSINLLSKGILEDRDNVGQTSNIADQYRWIIQSKFETPHLNFNHYTFDQLDVYSDNNPKTIGMWHQYGIIPENNEGVYLQISNIPDNWSGGALGKDPKLTGSLADLCGFSTDPARMGQLKETKIIKEAVVAIPFVERAGERKFFKLDRKDIKAALKQETGLIGQSVIDQIQRMQEYVFPPSMDFLRNEDVDPFAMYIFEFTHTLSKQDLADIWQGLSPDIGRNHEIAEATISHELLAHELLGSGAKYLPNKDGKFIGLDRNAREPFIEPDIQWMVFKVKKRAASNYFEKIFERNESNLGDKTKLDELSATSTGANLGVQYNWPYDFFSLVELVKIDAEVEFANATTTDEGTRIEPVKIKKE